MSVEYVKQSMMGNYKVVTTRKESWEWTHAVLPRTEYSELLEDIHLAYQDADRAEKDAADKIAAAEARAEAAIDQAYADIDQQLEELRQALAAAQEDLEHERGMNKTLLWMNQKRANAERDLRPKTEHTGYAVLRSGEKDQTYGTGKNKKVVRLWETVVQTPFSVQFSKAQARKESSAALFAKPEDGGWLIGRIGINATFPRGYAAMLADERAAEWQSRNVLLDTKWQANHKAGFWEMYLLHTKELGPVPDEMALPKKEKKDKGPKEMKQPKNKKVIPKITDEEEE